MSEGGGSNDKHYLILLYNGVENFHYCMEENCEFGRDVES